MATVSLVLELALVNYLPASFTNPVSVTDRFKCASLCMYNETCVTIIYNFKTQDCYFYDKHATEDDALSHPANSDVAMYSRRLFSSCSEVPSGSADGLYTIKGPGGTGIKVWCDMTTDGGQWLVFQRRTDAIENFDRGWDDYKNGFGDNTKAFWMGNDLIHGLTSQQPYELRLDLTDKDGATNYVKYSRFIVGSEASKYDLHVEGHTGGPGITTNGLMFSTYDNDNDPYTTLNCAEYTNGGWWVHRCGPSNLNGLWGDDNRQKGIYWSGWKGESYSLTACEMKIRRLP